MCAVCGWPIKAHRTRVVTDSDTVCCLRCVLERPTAAHTAAYPDCRLPWHSVLDHNPLFTATHDPDLAKNNWVK